MGSKTNGDNAKLGKQDAKDKQGVLGLGPAAKDRNEPASPAPDKQVVIGVGYQGSTSAATGNAGTGPSQSGRQ